MESNKGYTLIEIIIAIVIIGIISVGVGISLSYTNSMNTDAGLEALHITLDEARMESMSSGENNVKVIIRKGTDHNYYTDVWKYKNMVWELSSSYKFLTDKFEIFLNIDNIDYPLTDTNTNFILSPTETAEGILLFTYNKSTGAFKSIEGQVFADNGIFGGNAFVLKCNVGDSQLRIIKTTGRTLVEDRI